MPLVTLADVSLILQRSRRMRASAILQSQNEKESWDSKVNKVRHLRCSSSDRVK